MRFTSAAHNQTLLVTTEKHPATSPTSEEGEDVKSGWVNAVVIMAPIQMLTKITALKTSPMRDDGVLNSPSPRPGVGTGRSPENREPSSSPD